MHLHTAPVLVTASIIWFTNHRTLRMYCTLPSHSRVSYYVDNLGSSEIKNDILCLLVKHVQYFYEGDELLRSLRSAWLPPARSNDHEHIQSP